MCVNLVIHVNKNTKKNNTYIVSTNHRKISHNNNIRTAQICHKKND